jgi:glycosyltransferase 2 family protein
MAVHSASWLLKYIPGQVGSLLNKVIWGQKRGLSRTLVVITFIYENVFLQIASIVPSVVILLATLGVALFEANPVTLLLPLLALIPLAVVLVRPLFHRVLDFATKRILKQRLPEEYFLRTSSTLILLLEFLIPRILNAFGFVLVALAVTDVDPALWPLFGAAYVLAGAIGILAVFVPSGLGVREAVIFACLFAAGIPAGTAALISILSRLISTVADAVIALGYLGLRFSLRKDATE